MTNIGGNEIGFWDKADEFYYDVLHLPDGERIPLRLRSMVGLIPLFAVEVLDASVFRRLPRFSARTHWHLEHRRTWRGSSRAGMTPTPGNRSFRGYRLNRCLLACWKRRNFCRISASGLSPSTMNSTLTSLSTSESSGVLAMCRGTQQSLLVDTPTGTGAVWIPMNFLIIESLKTIP
jgi:hypothetical protein